MLMFDVASSHNIFLQSVINTHRYLRCVMDETHRHTNVGAFAARFSEKDMTLGGYNVPAKVSCIVMPFIIIFDYKKSILDENLLNKKLSETVLGV